MKRLFGSISPSPEPTQIESPKNPKTQKCEIYTLPADIFSLCFKGVSTWIEIYNNCLVSKTWSVFFSSHLLKKVEEKGNILLKAISNLNTIFAQNSLQSPRLMTLQKEENKTMKFEEMSEQLKYMHTSAEQMQQINFDQLKQEITAETTPQQHHLIVRQAKMKEELIDLYKVWIASDIRRTHPNILQCLSALSQIPLEKTAAGEEGKGILNQLIKNNCFEAALALVEVQQEFSFFHSQFIVNPTQQFFHFIISQYGFEEAKNVIGNIFNLRRRKNMWEGLVRAMQTEASLSIEKCEEWVNQMIDLIPPFEGESRVMLERVLISHVFCTIFQLYTSKQNPQAALTLLSKILAYSYLLTDEDIETLAKCIGHHVKDLDLDMDHQEEILKFLSCFPSPLLTPLVRSLVKIFNNSFMTLSADDTAFDAQDGLWTLICRMHSLLDADAIPYSTMDYMIYTCLLKHPNLLISIIENRELEFIEFPTLLVKFLENDPTTFYRLYLNALENGELTASADESDSDEFEIDSEENEFKETAERVQEAIIKIFPSIVNLLLSIEKSQIIRSIIQSFPSDQRYQLNAIAKRQAKFLKKS